MRGGRGETGKRVALAALAVASLTVAAGLAESPSASTPSNTCERPRIGFMGPITGAAAFIGKEQLGFARYAVRRLGDGRVRLVETDTQLDPRRAAAAAATLYARRDVLAVVGPAGSQEVLAAAPILKKGSRLPFISGSATQAALTNGSIPNFFRVVPNDRAQPATIARYIRLRLQARSVFVLDDETVYSRPLATRVQSALKAAGVKVTRASVDQSRTDFSGTIARIGADVDVVFLPWQVAASAQLFGRQLRRHGNQATIFGSDTLDSGDFTIAGSYVSAFAPDIRMIEGNAAFVRGYGAPFVSNFGPPVYVATQAAIVAIEKACADGEATRDEVQRKLQATFIPRIVLGGNLRFTARGDRKGATFSVFELGAGGKKTLVG